MCGIFGTINYNIKNESDIILKELTHRGPDQQNYIAKNNVELIHTRLAIQDLTESGRQPMIHNGLYISFNGEIYNHLELRKKYNLNHSSRSDTMTMLLLYERIGMKMLEEFDGMFAFCLYDTNAQKVFLVRDRAGKKPLFIWQKDSSLVFSSELNVLNQIVRPAINKSAVSDYLYLGYNFRNQTPYDNVWELENGSYHQIDLLTQKQKTEKWFDIALVYNKKIVLSENEALEQLDIKLNNAVKSRLESSDVEVGAFLSGGIDSGLVTAIASNSGNNLKTFTVRMPGAYDESELALQVAQKYHTVHTPIDISFDHLRNDFEKIIGNYGEPFSDDSAIPSYYVAEAAKEHITVVLNGDGADELFGGYRRYVPFRHFDFFSSNKYIGKLIGAMSSVLPVAHEKKSSYNYIYRLMEFASYKDVVKMYAAATSDLFVGHEDAFLKAPELTAIRSMLRDIKALNITGLQKILLADFNAILFGALLPKMDIATMAHSLEGRSPFLAKEILEFAPSIADKYKIRGVTTKYLLRTLAKKYLPEELINQPKRGFEVPLKLWIDNDLKEILQDHLFSSDSLYPGFIDKEFVTDLYNRRVNISDEKRAKMLYSILCLEVWHKQTTKKTTRSLEANQLYS
ncbi:MAG: asparagine synthase (glutamine-hydrolyzing) [Chitinophagaceae bacterium]|nr:asparagine synthase (glutamine-hydrolyzing) [Chitinophagaceae bacterium]